MCQFFSFVTLNGKPRHLSPAQIKQCWSRWASPNSHSVIASTLGLNIDRVNSYEFHPPKAFGQDPRNPDNWYFDVDQIRKVDDSARAESWVRSFIKTPEFAAICKASRVRFPPYLDPKKKLTMRYVKSALRHNSYDFLKSRRDELTVPMRCAIIEDSLSGYFRVFPVTKQHFDFAAAHDRPDVVTYSRKFATRKMWLQALRAKTNGVHYWQLPKSLKSDPSVVRYMRLNNPGQLWCAPDAVKKMLIRKYKASWNWLSGSFSVANRRLWNETWVPPEKVVLPQAELDAIMSKRLGRRVTVRIK